MVELIKTVEKAVEGLIDPFTAKQKLNETKKTLEELEEKLYPVLLEEAQKHDEKIFEVNGLKVEVRNGRQTFDYKNIQSWAEKKKELGLIEKEAKQAWELYKKGKITVDENGEQLPLPVVKFSKDSVIVKPVLK